MKMNAIQLTTFGDAASLALSQVDVPTPRADEILLKNHAIGVNFVDTQHRAGHPYPVTLPLILGTEAAGEIIAVGEAVTDFAVGQRVAVTGMVSIYADYCTCPQELLTPIPSGVSYEQAAAVLLQGMTAHALSHDAYAIQAGDTVLIQAAAGGVGLLLTQIARFKGATVIGTCSSNAKAAAIRAAGGDAVILYQQENVRQRVMEITEDLGVQAVFDAVGQATFDAGLESLHPQGHMVIFGLASGNVPPFDINRLSGIAGHRSQGCLSLTWASLSTYNAQHNVRLARAETVFGWLQEGLLDIKIAGRFPLSEASEAHKLLESRQAIGKILLIPQHEA